MYITTAMRGYPTDSCLQYSVLSALINLAGDGPAHITEKIEAAGGIVCITTAMRFHPTDCDLQCSAL